ncbi:hypothetical protein FA13DRAFT_335457 [Coprinellus micaceus]|uniref:Uncharacterized protein n=1 Tax=Coprinellus micaceus TaxID=71717 RepID=A0A4Y7TCG5_COPMI|nr:hypothetical protein FA13DRAFT_335457 [Coprinellus micaceus]
MSTITTHSRNSSSSSLSSKSLPPPPSPIKHAPNPHPYAIKTTSSALTSHTTSSPSHAEAYKHYVPPPSPSSRSRTSSLVGGENGRHRYSRNLAESRPQALPMTPGMERSGSVSPRKNTEFLELDQGGSPRRSRLLQLHDEEGYFGDGTVKSMRTPRQSGAMKRRAETLPSSANAPFVFPPPPGTARLRSDSLSDDNEQLSSNSYRHSHSRSHDDANSNKFASMRRSNGTRVRGMVESFERSASSSSGSELDGEGTRSRSSSPTKPTRRPLMVADLFSPTPASPDIGTTTLKPTSNRHSKELPRLLPYPPPLAASFFSQPPAPHAPLEQMHTGAAHPLPMSPEHTGSVTSAGVNGNLAEFGTYRPQSSNARLLPIPPDLVPSPSLEEEAPLHHPRPRRGGPPELVSVQALESEEELSMEELLAREGSNGKAVKSGVKTGVHGWDVDSVGDTVKRVPTGPRPLSSNRTKTPLKTKKVSSGARTHSSSSPKESQGSFADGEVDREADAEGDGVVGSISAGGFVNGRRGRRAKGLKPKARSSQDSLSEGGGLKKKYEDAGSQTDESDPDSPVAPNGVSQTDAEEEHARVELEERKREIGARTAELSLLSLEIEETQRELERTQLVLEERTAELDSRALALETRTGEVDERNAGVGEGETRSWRRRRPNLR